TVERVGVDVAGDARHRAGRRVLMKRPRGPGRRDVGATGGVVRDPERVVDEVVALHVVLPEVATRVDDRLDAGGLLDAIDPRVDRRGGLGGVGARAALDVDDRGQVAGLKA